MRRGVRHPAPRAARTDAATEAGERHEEIVAALIAVRADESVREHAAAEVAAELLLDVARERRLVGLARMSEEGLEVTSNDRVQNRLRRSTWPVGWRKPHGGSAFAERVPASR
jgi:hypothetical protein